MFKKGSFSRLCLGVFVVCAATFGVIGHVGSPEAAGNMANTARSIGEGGAGTLVGAAGNVGPDFEEYRRAAANPAP